MWVTMRDMKFLMALVSVLGVIVSLNAAAAGYYLCLDPKTGKKTGQDTPCQNSRELGNYAPTSLEEHQAREEKARQARREYERLHPGAFRPEDYMTEKELVEYHAGRTQEEARRKKQTDDDRQVKEAVERAERAEQRAGEAERAARAAEEKAAAAEAATRAQQPPHYPAVVLPPVVPVDPFRGGKCFGPNCPQIRSEHNNSRNNTHTGRDNKPNERLRDWPTGQ
jgi:hypothetical protein